MKYIKNISVMMIAALCMMGCTKEAAKTSPKQEEKEPPRVESSVQNNEPKAEQVKEEPAPAPVREKTKFIVCIDPGHQRKANLELEPIGPGATKQKYKVTDGTTGVVTKKREYELNLEAAVLLKEMLEAKGIEVVMTRTTHDVNMSNKERAAIANEHHANLFLRIHADGSESAAEKGFAVLTPSKENAFTKNIYQESLTASEFIVNKVKENSSVQVNGIKFRDDLSGFNWAEVPGVLLELGFMSNPEEDRKLSDVNYLRSLLQSVADSVEGYRVSKR
ncbi:N-acetylmuramoyl-L-alanine amidase family protein [Bacillus sp. BP-3]|uniref:N-acetylmuramoyl-L-alanine amidase family protein n=1 Tax=Bacillus sp. BP-3 TaxID=3022773 RepID=UPI00232CA644|nr:N-acetylmuramoyl-L-alanine amidase [Bacillus sp. BP-3]MDC2864986.1 N-acetylmuramoyl-L-alanine amidase [Bacillus sp. BP-3]